MTLHLLPVGIFVQLFRETLESDPFYSDLWLEGEISDVSRSAAGHVYFALRDDDGSLKCVLFRGQALRQIQLPRPGDQVAVHGGLSMYPRSGSVQLVADLVRPAGLGAASLELAYLRQRLEAEGLFDDERKRSLPPWPRTIGVVTSAHGAAWHDIQTVVERRFPFAMLVLSPARVQGLGAAESIVAALQAMQLDARVELIILARGGGASDDLAAFNDEQVVRAVFASRVPVVAGVGHATDRTLVEDVADRFAATPSAAAEICVPSVDELLGSVQSLRQRLCWAIGATQQGATTDLLDAQQRLLARSPASSIVAARNETRSVVLELARITRSRLAANREQVEVSRRLLATLNPSSVLLRGYAALQREDTGEPIFSISQLEPGHRMLSDLADGTATTVVDHLSVRRTTVQGGP